MLVLTLSLLIQNESPCRFERAKQDVFQLSVGTWSAEILVAGQDAKISKCEILDGSRLLSTEIDLGTAGTFAKVNETELQIFDLNAKDHGPLYKNTVREKVSKKDPKTGKLKSEVHEKKYVLRRGPDGEYFVYLSATKETIPLKITSANR